MKRTLWLVAALLFSLTGCAVRSTYYSRPSHEYWDRDQHRQDHDRDRDDYRRDR
jgi:predicted small lipoprotein YifL